MSSPSIGPDGTIYVSSYDQVYALQPDGGLRWKYRFGGDNWIPSPVVGADGTLYVGAYDNRLYAISEEGVPHWAYAIPNGDNGNSIWSDPTIGPDGTIYIGGASRAHVYAFDADGTLKWGSEMTGAAAQIALGSGGVIYAICREWGPAVEAAGRLYALSADGGLLWRTEAGGGISGVATDREGTIYVTTCRGVNLSEPRYGEVHARHPDGSLKWLYETGDLISSAPVIGADGRRGQRDLPVPAAVSGCFRDAAARLAEVMHGPGCRQARLGRTAANTAPPASGHSALRRTWLRQVRAPLDVARNGFFVEVL